MPRAKKYEVTESLASLASSQQAILSQVNDINNHRIEHIYESNELPERKKKKAPIGWIIAGLVSAMSIAFLLCVRFARVPGVPHHSHFTASKLLKKTGYLKVYPYLLDENTTIPGTYAIPLPMNLSYLAQMDNIINSYPDHSEDFYSSCYVSSPSFNRPCHFRRDWLGNECTKQNDFGYSEVNGTYSPCVLIQIADSFNWKPMIYKPADVEASWKNIYDPTFASIGCSIKAYKGISIRIFPEKGFSIQFFPQSNYNTSIYLPPSLMIQVNHIKVGTNVTMECWLRATNAYMLEDSGQITISFVQDNVTDNNSVTTQRETSQHTSPVTNSSTFYASTSEIQPNTTSTTEITTFPSLNIRPVN